MRKLQRIDIEHLCRQRGVTLDRFADELVYLQCHGIPADRVALIEHVWRLVSQLLAERRALELAQNCTLLTTCPHCGTPPRTTGGKHPATYCPTCDAVEIEVVRENGQTYHRWSQPKRPFVQATKRKCTVYAPGSQTGVRKIHTQIRTSEQREGA